MPTKILKATLVNDESNITTNHDNPLLTDSKNSSDISISEVRDKRNNNSTDNVTNSATNHKKVQEFAKGQFKPFIKESCPVCDDNRGNCRYSTTDPDFIQCQTYADARYKDVINGYICVKESSGHTASFKPYNGNYKRKSETEWLQEKALRDKKRREQNVAETKEKKEKALSAEERHKLYSEIRKELIKAGLRADLRESRGLTESENQVVEVYQIKKYHQLTKKYDERLPGLSKYDKSCLGNSGDGLIGFIHNADGLIVGFQYRLNNSNDGGRYRWGSSSEASVHTKEFGELPLAVYVPSEIKSLDIQLVEGTIIKPQIAAERMGMITIGASGGNFFSSEETLRGTIKSIQEKILIPKGASETPCFIITPDAGFAENKQVCSKLVDLYLWVEDNYKPEIKILDWNQICKSQGDIDEIQDLSIIRHLPLHDFKTKYREALQSCRYPGARFQNYLRDRKHLIADITQKEQYVSIPPNAPSLCDILLIQRSMGGGKTEAMLNHCLLHRQWATIVESYRNSLSHGTVDRASKKGLIASHVSEMKESIEGTVVNLANGGLDLIAGCVDSYHKMQAFIERNPDYQVIVDEVDSVLNHLKGGGTLKGRQLKAIEFFKESINNAQFTLMMDANLNQKIVELIKLLFPEKKVMVLKSEPIKKQSSKTFYFLETESEKSDFSRNPKHLPDHLVKVAKDALSQGKKVLWISDSQTSCEVIDELTKKEFKGIKNFRYDGKTSQDKTSKGFKDTPVDFIIEHKTDLLIISPSGESGLDLSIFDYYDEVCFDIRGVLGVNTLIQLSGRLRDTKPPIYVACPEFSNMTENLCPYPMKKIKEVINNKLEMLLAKSLEVDEELLNSEFIQKIFNEMGEKFSEDKFFISSLEDSQKSKYEHQNLKLCLKAALEQDGHRVIDLLKSRDIEVEEERKETKEFVKDREASQTFKAEDIDYEKAQELNKKELNWETKCKVTKAMFKHSLPGIENTESWSVDLIRSTVVDNSKFISQRWRLKQLQDPELFKAVFIIQKRYNFENGFSPKDIWKSNSTKIEALKLMGVGEIIEKGIFSSSDKWLQDIIDKYYEDDSWFQLIGITRAKKDKQGQYYKKMASRFLEYFGLETGKCKKVNGKRFYPIRAIEATLPFIDDIDKCLQKRAENTLNEAKTISLSQTILEVEKIKSRNEKWDIQYKELNIRKLEACLPEEWKSPRSIEDVAQMLFACDSPEMAKDLYRCDIPDEVFQLAEMQIPTNKQAELMAWRFS